MIVSPALEALKEIWKGDIFVVGGAVRDSLLGYAPTDVDLASPLTPDEVEKLLKDTPFTTRRHSPRLGTLGISGMGEKFEYTAFRSDSYPNDGSHTPTLVRFGVDISEDALRRDFTVNSVYYDLKCDKLVDPVGGVADIERKIVRTARPAREVLKEDALRILRMARFCGKLGFEADAELMDTAREMRETLREIAPERVRDELKGILLADVSNALPDAHVRAFSLMTDIGATRVVLPEVAKCVGVKQNPVWHKYDVYEHMLKTFGAIAPRTETRLAAILHDIGKPAAGYTKGVTREHPEFGAWLARERLTALRFPQKTVDRVSTLIRLHMFDLKGDVTEKEERIFILEHADCIADLIALKNADRIGSGLRDDPSPAAVRLSETFAAMKKEGVAFKIADLKAGGADTLALPAETRGYALRALLKENAWNARVRTEEGAKEFIMRFPASND